MSEQGDEVPSRSIFFPLRSSVELFSDPLSPDAVTKAKEAAVLFDELVFETGLLDVSITRNGSTSFWSPPEAMTPDLLDRSRKVNLVGSSMNFAIGVEDAPGVHAEKMQAVFDGEVSNAYLSEFHSGILDELAPLAPDWVRTIDIGREGHPGRVGDPLYEALRRLNFADFTDKELMSDVERFLRSFIYESFNRDATVAAALEASFISTPLFASMVQRGGVDADIAGSEALGIIVGDVGALPWEAVLEFRDHKGSQEARHRLREFERLAVESDPRDAYDFIRKIGHEVTRGFRAAVEELAPNLPEELAKQVLLNGVAMVSVIGAPVAFIAEAATTVSESRSFNRSWIAAVMVLTGRRGA